MTTTNDFRAAATTLNQRMAEQALSVVALNRRIDLLVRHAATLEIAQAYELSYGIAQSWVDKASPSSDTDHSLGMLVSMTKDYIEEHKPAVPTWLRRTTWLVGMGAAALAVFLVWTLAISTTTFDVRLGLIAVTAAAVGAWMSLANRIYRLEKVRAPR